MRLVMAALSKHVRTPLSVRGCQAPDALARSAEGAIRYGRMQIGKAPHSTRISLGTLEDHMQLFEIQIWDLNTEFKAWRPRWWDSNPHDLQSN